MFVKAEGNSDEKPTERKRWRSVATSIAAATVFSIALAAPVTIDLGGEDLAVVSLKSAFAAKGGNGGGKGGGPGGGGPGGGGPGNGTDAGAAGAATDSDRGVVRRTPITEPTVTAAQFTTNIRKFRPRDVIEELNDPEQSVSFYTVLRMMDGKQITHRWTYQGSVKHEMAFRVSSDSFKAWSTQRLPVDSPGAWTVEVIDENGDVLAARDLAFRPNAPDDPARHDAASGGFSQTMDKLRGLLKL